MLTITGFIRNDMAGNKGRIVTETMRSLVNVQEGAEAVSRAMLCEHESTI